VHQKVSWFDVIPRPLVVDVVVKQSCQYSCVGDDDADVVVLYYLPWKKNSPVNIEFMDEKLGDFGLPCPHVPFIWRIRLDNH
jgi:hypothetical protein